MKNVCMCVCVRACPCVCVCVSRNMTKGARYWVTLWTCPVLIERSPGWAMTNSHIHCVNICARELAVNTMSHGGVGAGVGFCPQEAPHRLTPPRQAGERLMVESPELHPGLTSWHLVFPPLHPHPWLGCPRARASHPSLSQEHLLPHPLCLLTCSL